jgi:hypothetical protein
MKRDGDENITLVWVHRAGHQAVGALVDRQ